MAKTINPGRIPNQNIVAGTNPVIDIRDPNRLFLKASAAVLIDTQQAESYLKYVGAPATDYVVDLKEEDDPSKDEANIFVLQNEVGLSSIENVTSSVYYDSLGNPKVKYVLKIRNSGIDKENIVGVDARIYNPFA